MLELMRSHAIDAVVNLAAESHVDRSIAAAAPFVASNVAGTVQLLEAARAAHVGRFLQVSTDEVYGVLGHRRGVRRDEPAGAAQPLRREQGGRRRLGLAYHHTFGMDVVIARCCNNYGPLAVSREADPADDSERARRSHPFRSTATGGRSATGSTSKTTARRWRRSCCAGGAVRSTTSAPRPSAPTWTSCARSASDRPGRDADPPRSRSTGARSALRDQPAQAARAPRLAPAPRLRARAARRSPGTVTTAPGPPAHPAPPADGGWRGVQASGGRCPPLQRRPHVLFVGADHHAR